MKSAFRASGATWAAPSCGARSSTSSMSATPSCRYRVSYRTCMRVAAASLMHSDCRAVSLCGRHVFVLLPVRHGSASADPECLRRRVSQVRALPRSPLSAHRHECSLLIPLLLCVDESRLCCLPCALGSMCLCADRTLESFMRIPSATSRGTQTTPCCSPKGSTVAHAKRSSECMNHGSYIRCANLFRWWSNERCVMSVAAESLAPSIAVCAITVLAASITSTSAALYRLVALDKGGFLMWLESVVFASQLQCGRPLRIAHSVRAIPFLLTLGCLLQSGSMAALARRTTSISLRF